MLIIYRGCIMRTNYINKINKKGVISISVIYSFFLIFCLLLVLILTTYTNNRINFKMLKNDIKERYRDSFNITPSSIKNLITLPSNETTDDIGQTYYYNGDVNNNYIIFGKYTKDMYINNNALYDECPSGETCTKIASAGDDMLWRIIRINGDGTIRLIYDGTIGNVSYNSNDNDAIYTGYKYSFLVNHGLMKDSTIKTYLDNWYKINLSGSKYEDYIVNSIFCINRNAYIDEEKTTIANGFGTNTQYFENYNNDSVTDLKCSNDLDRFSTNVSYNSNSSLIYPVGLISYEELTFIGLNRDNDNPNSFLTKEYSFWTLTPSHYNDGAYNYYVNEKGKIENKIKVSVPLAIRPVISISADTPVVGKGTKDDPYFFYLGGGNFRNYCYWGEY